VLALVGLAKTAMVTHQLPAHPRSAREARQATKASLHSWGLEQFADDAALLVTELMSNAVRHAHSSVEVAISLLPGAVRVEVSDSDPGSTVARVAASEDAESGRGLEILQSLASRWGMSAHPRGKTVWLGLDRRQPSQADVDTPATGYGPPPG
jgi:anti-sigma regulatory factor (Ser/Thr protein kinase)